MSAFIWEDDKTSIWGLRIQFRKKWMIQDPSYNLGMGRLVSVEKIWSFNRGNTFTAYNTTKHWTIWGIWNGISLS
jgi:hypothetical protein